VSALQTAISQSGASQEYQRMLALRRRKQREIDEAEAKRRQNIIHDMGLQLHQEKMVCC
jgi:hypothetical protein